MLLHLSILASGLAGARAVVRRQRARARQQALAASLTDDAATSLPPLTPAEIRIVMHHAEQAAIRLALGSNQEPANPYPPRTRSHILWETHFGSVLMEWDDGYLAQEGSQP
jgi:hypothetical protein